ncbi:hypothetical protein D3C86_2124770 [compost metagenome]
MLLANIGPQAQIVTIGRIGKSKLTVLDENWMRESSGEPRAVDLCGESIRLPAYAVARVDIPR